MTPNSPTLPTPVVGVLIPRSLLTLLLILFPCSAALPQFAGGTATVAAHSTDNRADGGARGTVRVNPRTLALEFSLSLMTYPGRNGLDVAAGLQYSSKVWRMDPGNRWWYPVGAGVRYVTDVNARFAEGSAAGWTSTVRPPVLHARPVFYDDYGRPWRDFLGGAAALDSLWQEAVSAGDGLMPHENFRCVSYEHHWCPDCMLPDGSTGAHIYICNGWEIGPGVPEPTGGGGPPLEVPAQVHYVPRLFVTMPSGERHEFRRSDSKIVCGTPDNICVPDLSGTFYSVDGSGLRLERDASGSRLLMPDGSAYEFPPDSTAGGEGVRAAALSDVNGNRIEWRANASAPGGFSVRDTLAREIPDPVPFVTLAQTQAVGVSTPELPWFGGTAQQFELGWRTLKPKGCEESSDPDCSDAEGNRGGALEDQSLKLHYDSRFFCRGSITDDLLATPSDPQSPANEVLFPLSANGLRPCSAFRPNGQSGTPVPVRFNPVVLESVRLPNGTSYSFRYNRYGEITKIIYPTGVYEEYDHGPVAPFNGAGEAALDQGNRGVAERRIFSGSGELLQKWTYSVTDGAVYTVRSEVSSAGSAQAPGEATEIDLLRTAGDDSFGFGNPLAGTVSETRRFDEAGSLASRSVLNWIAEGPLDGGEPNAGRDPRLAGTVSFSFEPGEAVALATLRTSEFDAASSAPRGHFPQLNERARASWDFAAIPAAEAGQMAYGTAAALIGSAAKKLSLIERLFRYDPGYLQSGLRGLVERERSLDPEDPARVLNETVFEFDSPDSPLDDPGNPTGWTDPQNPLRGNATAVRKLNTDTGQWLTERFEFDKFGNPVRSWDASDDEGRFAETEFSPEYAFAYPTAIVLPAPDPEGLTGSPQRFRTEKHYDLNTGLLTRLADLQDLGTAADDRVTVTRYDDPLLRVTAVEGPFGQTTRTGYADAQGSLTVTKRVLVDPGKWSESVTVADGFGRVVRTEESRSEGTSVVLTEYDLRGRTKRVSEPFLDGTPYDGITWKTDLRDPSGRVRKSFFLLPDGSLRMETLRTYGFAAVSGTAAVRTEEKDASGRWSRRLSDSLGRTVRLDEPVSISGESVADLGPVASPSMPTSYRYGKRGRVVEIRQGEQRRYFAWDAFGRLARQKLPEQEANPALAAFDADSGNSMWSSLFEYGPAGELISATDANGTVVSSRYDRHGRLTAREYSDGTPGAVFRYDLLPNGKGEVIESLNGVSATRVLAFDPTGNPVRVEQATAGETYEFAYEYALSGDLKSERYPSGKETLNGLDAFGDLRRVAVRAGGTEITYANAFRYDPDGRVSAIRLGNGKWESAGFDAAGRLANLGLGASAEDAADWKAEYGYGESQNGAPADPSASNGAVTRMTVASDAWPGAFVQSFRYDPTGRLSHADEEMNGTRVWSQEFGYDRFGNRLSAQTTIGAQVDSAQSGFDPATNRHAAASGFRYDRNGNVTAAPDGRAFIYDGRNKLAEVRSPDGVLIAKYEHDPNGRRVRSITPLETRVYVYSAGRLAAEYSTRTEPSRSVFVTTDHLGTPRVLTGRDGGVEARIDHFPFGAEIHQGIGHRTAGAGYPLMPPSIGAGYAGLFNDPESRLKHSEARKYDDSTGRFTSVDPLISSADAGDPRTLNRYTYTLNDPVNLVDPTGLVPVDDWYISRDGKIEVYRTEDPFDRFYVFDENKRVFSLVAQLEKNPYGLVRFPYSGYGFTSYNSGERGGYDPKTGEHVGSGDHYLRPVTAAALFGLTNQAKNDHGITIALGDMSSSNGSDPWDARFRTSTWNGHHASHGHMGNGTGTNIDFRYVDSRGKSRRGNWAVNPGLFDRRKNQAIFDLAKKWGFSKSLRGYNVPVRHTRAAKGHDDHGHLGFDLRRKRPRTIYQDRRKYYLRSSDFTLDCLVERCVGR